MCPEPRSWCGTDRLPKNSCQLHISLLQAPTASSVPPGRPSGAARIPETQTQDPNHRSQVPGPVRAPVLPSPTAPAAQLTVFSSWSHLFSEPSNGLNFLLLLLLIIFNPAFQVFRTDCFIIGLCYHVARTRILCMQPSFSPQGNGSRTPHDTKIREAQVYVKWCSLCI